MNFRMRLADGPVNCGKAFGGGYLLDPSLRRLVNEFRRATPPFPHYGKGFV
jgi:hypothetical protein